MQNIATKLKDKQDQLSNEKGIFRNEAGAIDLASVMVGIIVIGLIGGAIAATVFAVIPWTQDKAAKQQIDSLVSAQSAYRGLSSTIPPSLPTGHPANSYGSSDQLEEAGLLKKGPKYCSTSTDDGKGYIVFTRSDSGKIWSASDKKTSPESFAGTLPTDCQYIGAAAASADDLDGDGIPNSQDRDADGDGVQDGYVPGGPIAALDGTSYPTIGTYYSTSLTSGATTITSNASHSSGTSSRKVAMHFIVTCVKDDGSFYTKNMLNGYTAPTSSYNTNFVTTPCAAGERIDEYTVKPVTQEAMASGQISNPEYFGGYTFAFSGSPGGVHWSEPDGYPTSGKFMSAYLAGGGSTVYATIQNASGTATPVTFQYSMTCERDDKTTYKVTRLSAYTSRAGYIENTVFGLKPCGTDRITAYAVGPVKKLSEPDNRSIFNGYTITGGTAWAEEDGYPAAGSFQSAYLAGGGSTIYATVQNGSGTSYSISFQYITTCERSDKSTYTTNKLASYTSRAGYIENTVFGLTPCGTDRVIVYEISALKKLGDVDSRTNFGGYTITGGKTWKESDGYPTSGSFQSAYLSGGSTIYATVQNGSGTATPLAFQYTATCERADKSTYTTNKIANYTSRAGYIENTVFGLTPCGTDRVTIYDIFPVNKLGDADNRTIFGGYTMTGSKSWVESRDGYQMSGNFVSSNITGTTLYAKFRNETGTSMTLSTNYTMTCEKADKSTYSVNKIATYTSRASTIEETTFGFTDCGTDRIKAYTIAPVTTLADVSNRDNFKGYSLKGSYSWAG